MGHFFIKTTLINPLGSMQDLIVSIKARVTETVSITNMATSMTS